MKTSRLRRSRWTNFYLTISSLGSRQRVMIGMDLRVQKALRVQCSAPAWRVTSKISSAKRVKSSRLRSRRRSSPERKMEPQTRRPLQQKLSGTLTLIRVKMTMSSPMESPSLPPSSWLPEIKPSGNRRSNRSKRSRASLSQPPPDRILSMSFRSFKGSSSSITSAKLSPKTGESLRARGRNLTSSKHRPGFSTMTALTQRSNEPADPIWNVVWIIDLRARGQ